MFGRHRAPLTPHLLWRRAGALFSCPPIRFRAGKLAGFDIVSWFHAVQLHGRTCALIFLNQGETFVCTINTSLKIARWKPAPRIHSSPNLTQVTLVELGALRPLVSMMAVEAEPRHYAGLALLKLADNFENHIRIAEEGGIQALLRLGRARSTDEELQYKAALTVGHLASNAVKLLPKGKEKANIGFGATVLQNNSDSKARRAQKQTQEHLDQSLRAG